MASLDEPIAISDQLSATIRPTLQLIAAGYTLQLQRHDH